MIAANIECRKAAEDVLTYVLEESKQLTADHDARAGKRFLTELCLSLKSILNETWDDENDPGPSGTVRASVQEEDSRIEAMNDAQARSFENEKCTFGKYKSKGWTWGEVIENDMGYVDWLLDQETIQERIESYLANEDVQRSLG